MGLYFSILKISTNIFRKIAVGFFEKFGKKRLHVGVVSEEIDFFVLESLAMKLREYTRNTPIRRNPVSKFRKKIFLTVIF